MCLKKLKNLFHTLLGRGKPALERGRQALPRGRAPRKWWEFPVRLLRTTRRGGPNMPKSQRCPDCGAWAKRESKTIGGARYRCHNTFFFVRKPTKNICKLPIRGVSNSKEEKH